MPAESLWMSKEELWFLLKTKPYDILHTHIQMETKRRRRWKEDGRRSVIESLVNFPYFSILYVQLFYAQILFISVLKANMSHLAIENFMSFQFKRSLCLREHFFSPIQSFALNWQSIKMNCRFAYIKTFLSFVFLLVDGSCCQAMIFLTIFPPFTVGKVFPS